LLEEDFLSFLPLQTVQKELLAGELVSLDIAQATIERQSGVMIRRNAVLSPAAQDLLDIVLRLGADPGVMVQM